MPPALSAMRMLAVVPLVWLLLMVLDSDRRLSTGPRREARLQRGPADYRDRGNGN